MQLMLKLIKGPQPVPTGLENPSMFGTAGGSIGRAPDCQLVLPERYVSRVHAEIRWRNKQYSLKVLSRNNPVIINGTAVEHQQACEIRDGDRIEIGDYEFLASFVNGPTADRGRVPHAGLDQLAPRLVPGAKEFQEQTAPDPFSGIHRPTNSPQVPASPIDTPRADPLLTGLAASCDELLHIIGVSAPSPSKPNKDVRSASSGSSPFVSIPMPGSIDGKALDLGLPRVPPSSFVLPQAPVADDPEAYGRGTHETSSSFDALQALDALVAGHTPNPSPSDFHVPVPGEAVPGDFPGNVTPPPDERAVGSPLAGSQADVLRSLYRGLGLPVPDFTAEEAERAAELAGQLVAASIKGLFDLIAMRKDVRDGLKIDDRTIVSSQLNNPLKHVESYEEALRCIIDSRAHGKVFLSPLDSVRQSFSDLQAHEMAMVAGMRAALTGLLQRFAPDKLEQRIKKGSKFGLPLPGITKSRLWDLFVEMHEELNHEAQDDFDALFGKEFVKAYMAQSKSR